MMLISLALLLVAQPACVPVFNRTSDYYTHWGSHAVACFIDFSKAIDRVSYWKLFHKLLQLVKREKESKFQAQNDTLYRHISYRSTLGDRAFPVAASRAWNSLPASVRDIQSLPASRQKLKLTLFSDYFAS